MRSPLDLSTLFLKNAEFTQTPPLRSLPELRLCGVRLNAVKMRCSNELLTVFSKNVEFDSTSHMFLQNAESASTPHSAFTKCVVCLNSPLCFWKMRSSHALCLSRVCLNSPSMESAWTPILFLKNAEFKRTPHCVLQKCGVCFNSPFSLYKMRSLLELPTVHLKNAEFIPTPHSVFTTCAVCLNPTWSFSTMQSLFPHYVFKKCYKLCPVISRNGESAWAPHSVFQKCGAQMNSPLCLHKCRVCFNSLLSSYKMGIHLNSPLHL